MTAVVDELIPLERHRRDVLSRIRPMEPLTLGLGEAHGCVLAEDVVAPADVPAFANSAMDGFAVQSAGLQPGATLTVIGEVAAGALGDVSVASGQAVRIMTGAPLPPGADAVIPLELVEERDGAVVVGAVPQPGEHLRAPGGDVRGGEVVLAAGTRLRAADVAMCAAVGRSRVLVHPRPRVVVIATGDELVEPDAALRPGQIHDSNSFMLAAQVREAGAQAFRHPIVGDDRAALAAAFEGATAQADLLVTSGGVSAGRYDLVKRVLAELGDVRSSRVGMQPGMPQAFGFVKGPMADAVPCFGLPGNPVSSYVSFEVFVRPAIRRLQGRRDLNRPRVRALLDDAVTSPPQKVSFLRVALRRSEDGWHARTTGPQGSSLLRSLLAADGLAEIPADRTEVAAGEEVLVHLLVDPS